MTKLRIRQFSLSRSDFTQMFNEWSASHNIEIVSTNINERENILYVFYKEETPDIY